LSISGTTIRKGGKAFVSDAWIIMGINALVVEKKKMPFLPLIILIMTGLNTDAKILKLEAKYVHG
jgi:hypothetical protein